MLGGSRGESDVPRGAVGEVSERDAKVRNLGRLCVARGVAVAVDSYRDDARGIGVVARGSDESLQQRARARCEDDDSSWVLTRGSQRTSPELIEADRPSKPNRGQVRE